MERTPAMLPWLRPCQPFTSITFMPPARSTDAKSFKYTVRCSNRCRVIVPVTHGNNQHAVRRIMVRVNPCNTWRVLTRLTISATVSRISLIALVSLITLDAWRAFRSHWPCDALTIDSGVTIHTTVSRGSWNAWRASNGGSVVTTVTLISLVALLATIALVALDQGGGIAVLGSLSLFTVQVLLTRKGRVVMANLSNLSAQRGSLAIAIHLIVNGVAASNQCCTQQDYIDRPLCS